MTTTETTDRIAGWFAGQLPERWFVEPADVRVDNEEVLIVGRLAAPELAADASDDRRAASEAARIKAFREETRDKRIAIASEAEHSFGRKVSWGATCGSTTRLFTTAGVPVMTRLRMDERAVLDTLVHSGVARSRSDALAWCVRLVGRHEADWLSDLRQALVHVTQVRAEGPTVI
jgi:hypothetical protein